MSQLQSPSLRGADRFRIEREIADTLQGRIYAGTDLLTNKAVVIKEAWRQLVHSGRSRKGHRVPENFLQERTLVMTLTNLADCTAGIVRGIDEWQDEHCYYYAMEYCEGELFDYISKTHTKTEYQHFVQTESMKPQIPMQQANEWIKSVTKMFKQICESVQWMHTKGYCHLDLSLENSMISDINTLNVKLIDFGLTQHFDNNDFQFRGKVGKLQYMCPEAYARQTYDAKAADVWCLGVMLFMMLIGAPPYAAPQPQNAAFNYFVTGRIGDVLKHWKRLRLITVDALDLLNKIFKYQHRRISLEEVLDHPFFRSIQEKKPERRKHNMQVNDDSDVDPMQEIDKNVSNMSLEDDDAKQIEDNSDKIEKRNTYCDMILHQWGLQEISDTLHLKGWSQPKQWGQLTRSALKYEIGLNEEQSQLFLQKYKINFGQSQSSQNMDNNDPNQQMEQYTTQQQQQAAHNDPNQQRNQREPQNTHNSQYSHRHHPHHPQ